MDSCRIYWVHLELWKLRPDWVEKLMGQASQVCNRQGTVGAVGCAGGIESTSN